MLSVTTSFIVRICCTKLVLRMELQYDGKTCRKLGPVCGRMRKIKHSLDCFEDFSDRAPHVERDGPYAQNPLKALLHLRKADATYIGCIDGVDTGHHHQGRSVRTRVPSSQDTSDGGGGGGPRGVQAAARRLEGYSPSG